MSLFALRRKLNRSEAIIMTDIKKYLGGINKYGFRYVMKMILLRYKVGDVKYESSDAPLKNWDLHMYKDRSDFGI